MHTSTTPDDSRPRPRKERKDITAEAISQIADRWEAFAQHLRPWDKQVALAMMKDAARLQAYARTIERDAKRRRRAKKQREDRQWELLRICSERTESYFGGIPSTVASTTRTSPATT